MDDDKRSVVVVKDLYKSFKLPHDQHSGIKQYLVNIFNSKRGYEIQHVLDDISFEIKEGDFFGIVGRNGSGKSTLLKLLAGIYAPDKGLVHVDGSLTPFIELGVGFNPELTGRENVFMNGALLGFSKKEMDEMYDDIVKFSEIENFMDQKLKNYSSGMQVRLAFSIAIRARSDVLLIDEVLAVGDAAFQQKCFDYFERLKKSKQTVILVTHDMSAVKRFCNRALLLENGKIKSIGLPEDIADIYTKDNISNPKDTDNKSGLDSKQAEAPDDDVDMSVQIISDSAVEQGDFLEVKIDYPSFDIDHYIGISIQNGGLSIAELNSKPISLPMKNTSIRLKINTLHMNPATYQLGVAVFEKETGALITFNNKASTFLIKGFDETRGGVLKLDGTWKI